MNFNRVIHLKNPTEILQNSKLAETKNTIDSTSDTAKTRRENEKTGGNFQTRWSGIAISFRVFNSLL